jgi:hypothetical protein
MAFLFFLAGLRKHLVNFVFPKPLLSPLFNNYSHRPISVLIYAGIAANIPAQTDLVLNQL